MARQKFAPSRHGAAWALGAHAIEERPDHVRVIGECLTLWPAIEVDLALGLGGVLGAHSGPMLAAFMEIRAGRAQRDAFTAAAGAELPDDELRLVHATLKVVASSEKTRNDLAHAFWGISYGLADGVIWLDPKHMVPWNLKALRKSDMSPTTQQEIEKHMFVYTMADLEEVKVRLARTRLATFNLAMMLQWKTQPDLYAHSVAELNGMAEIKAALDVLDAKLSSGDLS